MFLGALIALGVNASAAHDVAMAMSGPVTAGQAVCDGCGHDGNGSTAAADCAALCLHPAIAPPGPVARSAAVVAPHRPKPARSAWPGRTPAPDPHPPRASLLG